MRLFDISRNDVGGLSNICPYIKDDVVLVGSCACENCKYFLCDSSTKVWCNGDSK